MSDTLPSVGEHAGACEHPEEERVPILRHGVLTETARCAACGALVRVRDGVVVGRAVTGL